MNHPKNEQGTALIATLMFLIAMGVLSTALVFTVNNEMKTSTSYKYSQQAFYVANAAIQNAVQWYDNTYIAHTPASDYDLTTSPVQYGGSPVLLAGQTGYTSAYPDATTKTSFSSTFNNISLQANTNNSGVYALNAKLMKYTSAQFINLANFTDYDSAIERWRLNSTGYWGSVAKPLGIAQITAVVENSGNSLFDKALWGIDSVKITGGANINSYDPTKGAWNATTNSGNMGDTGSNGWVYIDGNVDIQGDLAYGPSGTLTLGANPVISGDVIHLPEPRVFPPVPSFYVGTSSITVGANDTLAKGHAVTLSPSMGSPGTGQFKDIKVQGDLILNGGTYYIDSLTVTSQGMIHLNGDAKLFVKSAFDLEGQGVVNNTVGSNPPNLTVYYYPNDPNKLTQNTAKLSGSASVGIDFYGPGAPLQLTGGTEFMGSFVAESIQGAGGTNVHFNSGNLEKHLVPRPFRIINWSQDTQ